MPAGQNTRGHVLRRMATAFAVIAACLGAAAPSAHAGACAVGTVDKTWTNGGSDGLWTTGANWSPTGPPTNASDVCIPAGAGTVTISANAAAATFEAARPMVLSGGTFTVLGASTTSSSFDFTGGTISGAGTLQVLSGGSFNWTGDGSTMLANGIVQIDAGATFEASGTGTRNLSGSRTLLINGAGVWKDGVNLAMAGTAKLDVGGSLDIQGADEQFYVSANSPQVRTLAGGTLKKSGTGTFYVSVPVVNNGTVEAAAGQLHFYTGTAAASSGAWKTTGGLNVLASGTFALSNASVIGAGTGLQIAGATVNLTGVSTVAATATLDLAGGTLGGAGDLDVSGTFLFAPGTTHGGAGNTQILSGANLAFTSTVFNNGSTLDARVIQIDAGGTGTNAYGRYTNLANGARIDVAGDLLLQAGLLDTYAFNDSGGTGTRSLRTLSGGRVETDGAGAPVSIYVPVENDGEVIAADADLILQSGGAGTSTGDFRTTAGDDLTLAGGTYAVDGSTFDSTGGRTVVSSILSLTTDVTAENGEFVLAPNGTLTGAGAFTQLSGELEWQENSTMTGPGGTTIAAGASLRMDDSGPSTCCQRTLDGRTLTIASGATGTLTGTNDTYFTNNGRLLLSGTFDFQSDDYGFYDAGGTGSRFVRVLSGGLLRQTHPANTSALLDIPLENDGTVEAVSGDFRFGRGGSGVSSGVFKAAAGRMIELGAPGYSWDATPTLEGAGKISVVGILNVSAAWTVPSGLTLELAPQGTIGGAGNLAVNGTLRWLENSTQTGAGTTTISSGGQLNITENPTSCCQRTLERTVAIASGATGLMTGSNDTYLTNDGRLEIGGVLDYQTDDYGFYDAGGAGTRSVRVLPGGLLRQSDPAQGNAYVDAPIENDGTIEATQGDFEFARGGSGVSTGEWKASAGRLNRLLLGTFDVGAATVNGAGRLEISGTLNTQSATTMTVPSGSEARLIPSGVLGGAGTLSVAGTLNLGSNTVMSGSGTTKIVSGGSLVTSDTTCCYHIIDERLLRIDQGATATLGGPTDDAETGLQNGGRIEVAGTLNLNHVNSANWSIWDNGLGGEIDVLPTGTLARTAAGTAQINAPLDNQGTVSVPTGLLAVHPNQLVNWNAGTSTLGGGTYSVAGTANLKLDGVTAQRIAGKVILDGVGSKLTHDGTNSALAGLNTVTTTGGLTLRGARALTATPGLTNNGLVSLGAGSTLTVGGGPYTQTSTGTLDVKVGGLATTQFGRVVVNGANAATLGGTLTAEVVSPYVPVHRDKVQIVTANSQTHTWAENTTTPLKPIYAANNVKLVADAQAPAVTIAASGPPLYTNDTTPAFTGTGGTLEGDQASVSIALFAGSTATGTNLTPGATATVSGGNWSSSASPTLAEGVYTLRARQSDDVNNVGEVTKTFTVDTTDPAPQIAASGPKPRTNDTSATISGTGGTAAGDDSQVTVALFTGSTATPGNEVVSDTVVALGGGGSFSHTAPSVTLSEGTYTWRVKQNDAATNDAEATKTFVVDLTPPSPTIGAAKPASRTAATMPDFAGTLGTDTGDIGAVEVDLFAGPAATGTDLLPAATGTIAGGNWSFANASPVLTDGTYTLRVRQLDTADNSGSATKTFVVDTTKPSPSIDANAPAARTKTLTPMFEGNGGTATGDESTVEVQVFTGPDTSGTAQLPNGTMAPISGGRWSYSPSPALADGEYTLRVRQSDDVANTETVLRTFIVDNVPPALTFASSGPPAKTNVTTPQASGTAGAAAGDGNTVTLDLFAGPTATGSDLLPSATASVSGGSWSFAAGSPTLAQGTYTWRATVSDSAGNENVVTKTFEVDTTKPTIATSAITVTAGIGGPVVPEGGTIGSRTVRVTFAANETSTYECKLEHDGALQSFQACASPFDASSLADGSYKFTVRATDEAGNVQQTPTERTFTVVRGITLEAGVINYDAGAVNDVITVRSASGVFVIKNTAVASLPAGEGCSQLSDIEVSCPSAGVTRIDITGGGGNDSISAPVAMAQILSGGTGNDRLSGGSAADTLNGDDGDDLLDGRLGGDTMNGNAGIDTVTYAQRTTPLTLSFDGVANDGVNCGVGESPCENDALGQVGTSDVEIVAGGTAADKITGSASADTLTGNGGADTLNGLGGNDVLNGGNGDDSLVGGPGGTGNTDADVMNGGDGEDTADYSARTAVLKVSLNDVANDGITGEGDNAKLDIENAIGGSAPDELQGNRRVNRLVGNGGNDLLDGGFGSDVLDGGAGAIDRANYSIRSPGVTVDLSGLDATREADAGNADDESGDGRRDLLLGMEGALGGAGPDLLIAGSVAANLAGNSGADRIEVRNTKNDNIKCGGQADVVIADLIAVDTQIENTCETVHRG